LLASGFSFRGFYGNAQPPNGNLWLTRCFYAGAQQTPYNTTMDLTDFFDSAEKDIGIGHH
jgi:hypothetical protein